MNNVPNLRFKEFSDEWLSAKLGKLSDKIVAGGTPSTLKPEYWNDGDIRWMSSGELNHKNVYEVEKRITKLGLEKSSTKLIPEHCVLVGLAGQGKTRGTVAMNMVELCINQSIAAIFPNKEKFDEGFLYHNLDNRYEELRRLSTGDGGRGGLNLQIIKGLDVSMPSQTEQQKIAAFLTAVDTKIEQLSQKEALLKQYKKGVMQKIFSQEIRFKADDGSEFPEWEMKPLGSIFKEVTERVGTQDIETYSISAGKGFVSQKEKFGRDISGQQNEKYTVLRPNQFSYNKGNSKTYTYGCVYPNTLGHPIALPNVFISFDLIDSKYSVAFFAKLFENHYLDRSLRRIISSSARMDGLLNVNKADFFRIRLPVPSHEEQQKAGEFLSKLDVKLVLAQQELDAAKAFKKGLLQQMFV